MRREVINGELALNIFDFFYWFSRFEFALKENGYLKSSIIGNSAEVDWSKFAAKFESRYQLTDAAAKLIGQNPKRQVVGRKGLTFSALDFDASCSDLKKVVRLVQVVRNNLFHGGKHGYGNWDQPDRMGPLLVDVVTILGELACVGNISDDYQSNY